MAGIFIKNICRYKFYSYLCRKIGGMSKFLPPPLGEEKFRQYLYYKGNFLIKMFIEMINVRSSASYEFGKFMEGVGCAKCWKKTI